MRTFEQAYLRTLRHIYDTERQLFMSVPALCTPALDSRLTEVLIEIAAQSQRQLERLETMFRVLYKEPQGEAAWAATALLREAWEAAAEGTEGGGTEACAAALLALKRYELTLYEMLLRWSEQCDLYEALPAIRSCSRPQFSRDLPSIAIPPSFRSRRQSVAHSTELRNSNEKAGFNGAGSSLFIAASGLR